MDWRPFGETELLGQILQDQQWGIIPRWFNAALLLPDPR